MTLARMNKSGRYVGDLVILPLVFLSACGQQKEESIRFLFVIHSMEPMIITNTLFSFLQISLILLQERLVLAVFYYATGGDQWSQSTNWLSATHHEDNWYGVTTDSSTDYVLKLDLFNNDFSGSIPTEIGSLTSLQYLFLDNNDFSGSIPDGVCDVVRISLRADCDNCDVSKDGCCGTCYN